jgi:hypothetical protein
VFRPVSPDLNGVRSAAAKRFEHLGRRRGRRLYGCRQSGT